MIQFNLSGAEYQNNFQFKCFLSSNKLKIELLDYNRMKGSTDHFLNSDFGRNSVVFVSTQKKKKKSGTEIPQFDQLQFPGNQIPLRRRMLKAGCGLNTTSPEKCSVLSTLVWRKKRHMGMGRCLEQPQGDFGQL